MRHIPATIENLNTIAAKPITKWLIQAAKDRSSLSYGTAKVRLETECNFETIFSAMMGKPCGALMDMIHTDYPQAPLLNVLMVRSSDGYAGPGAGSYMANWFAEPRLAEEGIHVSDKRLWRSYADKAASEVYAYGDKWDEVFRKVFGEQWSPEPPRLGKEKDGTKFGKGGEGPNHKALRFWTKANPGRIDPKYATFRTETEVVLESADRVDVVFYGRNATIALEVKSMDSNYDDLRRGVFQCIKYRAVMKAMDIRHNPPVEAVLVTQHPLPGDLKAIMREHDIRHFKAPMDLDATA